MSKKVKMISHFSIMVMVMGGTIGAGIFFKNKTLSEMAQGHFGIVMATWGVGILAMLAMALALVEVTSAQKTDKGILEWVKIFCPKWFNSVSSTYFKWIFIPVTMFTIPIYFVNAIEDAGIPLKGEWSVLLFAFGIFLWLMVTNLLSLKFAEVAQWIFTVLQTIPLIALPIIAFINFGDVEGSIGHKDLNIEPTGLIGMSPWLATIAGISAISFAYDGFYASASVRNEMKDSNKLGLGLAGGVIGTSIVYLFLTIGFNVAGDGAITGLKKFMSDPVFKMFNGFVGVGILGVVNTFAMSAPRQFKDMAKSKDKSEGKEVIWFQKLIFRSKYQKHNDRQLYWSGWSIVVIITTILFLIGGPIGSYVYANDNFTYDNIYEGSHIYGFADIITNFTSLLVFVILTTAILGCLINRSSKKIATKKSQLFVPCAIFAIVVIYAASLYMVFEALINSFGFNGANAGSSLVVLVTFIIIISCSFMPLIYKKISNNYRHARVNH